jgi:circadian clock protein KaiA
MAIAVTAQLSLYAFPAQPAWIEALGQVLDSDRYTITPIQDAEQFLDFARSNQNQLDCLILGTGPEVMQLCHQLAQLGLLFPAVILGSPDAEDDVGDRVFYHTAEVWVQVEQVARLMNLIDTAIAQFIELSPKDRLTPHLKTTEAIFEAESVTRLSLQQRRLSEKLKERLGYLGVYYKRDPKMFIRNLPESEGQQFLTVIKSNYREIILNYFSDSADINNQIDELVNISFFADISVTLIVEIHMELMDEFAKQLQLEGRSEEILLDYRLTLIDVIAHLCELYRRSIPRDA